MFAIVLFEEMHIRIVDECPLLTQKPTIVARMCRESPCHCFFCCSFPA